MAFVVQSLGTETKMPKCLGCVYCIYDTKKDSVYCVQSKLRNKLNWLLGKNWVTKIKLKCRHAKYQGEVCMNCEYCRYDTDAEIFYCVQNKLRNKLSWLLGVKQVYKNQFTCKHALMEEKQK